MEQNVCRKFAALESDVTCECKTINMPVDSSMDLHNHDGHEILLVLSGAINFYTELGGIRLERGDLICVRELEFHRGELLTKDRYDRIVINVKSTVLQRISSKQTDLEICFERYCDMPVNVIHLSEKEVSVMEGWAQVFQKSLEAKVFGDELLADAFLKLIMVEINRHFINQEIAYCKEIMPELVVETFNYIENHLSEEISLKKLEDHVHHNGRYISRCFKKITGISLQQFIIAKKIALSCQLLREGYTPCDVCYMTGFNNYSNYSRTFSKQMGMSPKKYQMENR